MTRAEEIAALPRYEIDGRVARILDEDVARVDAAGCFVHNPWKGRHPRYQPTRYQPTVIWSQGGTVVELLVRLGMDVHHDTHEGQLRVSCTMAGTTFTAPSLLEAAMRCLVFFADSHADTLSD